MITSDNLNWDNIAEAAAILGIKQPFVIDISENLMAEAEEHNHQLPSVPNPHERILRGTTIMNLDPIMIKVDGRQSEFRISKTLWHELTHIGQVDSVFGGNRKFARMAYNLFDRKFGYDHNPLEMMAEAAGSRYAVSVPLVKP